jgi:peptidoglycan/LPS O-acetylase OafA/YrhL
MNGVRAIAALTVVGFHVGFLSHASDYSPVGPWLWQLNVGVTVFFVISGFLLYRPFAAARRGAGPRRMGDYARNRALRILPAYWVS